MFAKLFLIFVLFLVKCEDEIGKSFTCDVKEVTDGKGIQWGGENDFFQCDEYSSDLQPHYR